MGRGLTARPMTLRRARAIDRLARRRIAEIYPLLQLALYATEWQVIEAEDHARKLALALRWTERRIAEAEARAAREEQAVAIH